MFDNTQMPSMNLAFPDVCNTPVGPAVVPIPYPNIATSSTAVPNIFNIFITCMPAHNLMTPGTISNGDQAGVMMGVASAMIMGPSQHLMGSVKVFKNVMPTTKMTSPTRQNGLSPNCVGATLTPSQVRVLTLC